MRTLWNRIVEPSALLVYLGVFFLLLGFSWALISDSWNTLFNVSGFWEVGSDPKTETREGMWLYRLFFGHPWWAFTTGVIWGCLVGTWDRKRTLTDLGTQVESECLRAQGRHWDAFKLVRAHRLLAVPLLLAPLLPAFAFGMSVKVLLYALAGPILILWFPVQRQVYKETIARLRATEFDERMRRKIIRWEKHQRLAAAMMFPICTIMIAIILYLSIGLSLRIRHQIHEIEWFTELRSAVERDEDNARER